MADLSAFLVVQFAGLVFEAFRRQSAGTAKDVRVVVPVVGAAVLVCFAFHSFRTGLIVV